MLFITIILIGYRYQDQEVELDCVEGEGIQTVD